MPNNNSTDGVGNIKEGPHISFMLNGDEVMLRPYIYGWELCWKRKMRGEVVWQGEKFFSNLASAVSALFEYELRASDASTLGELRQRIEEIRIRLTEVYNTTIKGDK